MVIKPLKVAAVAVFALLAAPCGNSNSYSAFATEIEKGDTLSIEIDKAKLVDLPGPASTVFVANPEIADVQVPNRKSFLVFGKQAGSTTIYAFVGGQVMSYPVIVTKAESDISAAIKKVAPKSKVKVSSGPGGATLSGQVESPLEAAEAADAAKLFVGKDAVNNNIGVAGSAQVNLRVMVAEVSRNVTKNLGFNWDALLNNGSLAIGLLTGREPVTAFGQFIRDPSTNQLSSIGVQYSKGNYNVATIVDALQDEGLITVLAEPNLTALSGEPANFLAGGEFPVPVSQGPQQITIEWKRFGVSVDFTPTVLNGNRISVRVRPEVSELSDAGSIVLDNIKVPSIAVRRADTTVELASGQSFAIAGLFQNNVSNSVQRVPWLGEVPVLGALFRSSAYQRNESELVIIVTPYIVKPVSDISQLHLPNEGLVFANDLEQVLLGRLTSKSAAPHLRGPAGFMLEE
jgi:pilus assembly protein CpaC